MLKVDTAIETQQASSGRRITCPGCGAMMLQACEVSGVAQLRIKCRRCKSMVLVSISKV